VEESVNDKHMQNMHERLTQNLGIWTRVLYDAEELAKTNPAVEEMSNDVSRIIGIAAQWIAHHKMQLRVLGEEFEGFED
jgi:hypothetical protein